MEMTSPNHDIDARRAQRARRRARVDAVAGSAAAVRVDRLGPLLHLIAACRATSDDEARAAMLAEYIEHVRVEVDALEATVTQRHDGAGTRRALDLLQRFGRLSTLDYDSLGDETRTLVVSLLGLEYRWCFAAAGTTPGAFKAAIGRTGAR